MLQFSLTKKLFIIFMVLLGFYYASPNFLPQNVMDSLPDWYTDKTINLGLDLQGGTYMVLEVDVEAVLTERLDALEDDARRTLRDERIRYTGLNVTNDNAVTLNISRDEDLERGYDLLEDLSQPVTINPLVAGAETLDVTREGNRITLRFTDEGIEEITSRAVEQSIEVVRRRIDELGTKEPSVQRQGTTRILIQLPGANFDSGIINQTARLTFHLVDETVTLEDKIEGRIPPRTVLYPYVDPEGTEPEDGIYPPENLVPVLRRAGVSGENLTDAQPTRDTQRGLWVVSLSFDSRGGAAFCRLSSDNVGKPFAIVLDEKVISTPVIQEPICGGRGQISGTFTAQSAAELAALLRAGALPAPLNILEERSVGPGLGADSVEAGKTASIIGFVAVIVFIAIYYQGFGLAANAALIINMVLILGALSLLQATLTLPGIAGIVLTIGMAVDANVLIFERVREEVGSGKPPLQAVSTGYSSAMSTILDANITTFIAAVILFVAGTGPVKGFAVTLSLGIITSVFSAVTLTRLMVATWLHKKRPKTLKA